MRLSRAIVVGLIPVFIGCAALIDLEPGELDSSSSGSSSGSGGAGTECATNNDCPVNTECTTWGCSDGVCVLNVAPDGTPVATGAVAGDCKKNVCQDGKPAVLPDDTDLVEDNDPCTVEACNAGTKQKGLAPDGTACGSTGKLSCLSGLCSGCSGDSGNCDPPTQCQAVTCPVNTCTYETLVGKVVSDPVQDDCKQDVCDANGNVATVGDATEMPPQVGDICKVEQCAADGTVVQMNGNDFAKCANPSGICFNDSVCIGGGCVTQLKQAGTKVDENAVDGDCKSLVCDGMGGTVEGADDTDLPSDFDPADCNVPVCVSGSPSGMSKINGDACSAPPSGKCCGGLCCANTGIGYCDSADQCCASGKTCAGTCCPNVDDNCVNNVCCAGSVCGGACCQTDHECTGNGVCCPAQRRCPNGITCCAVGQTCEPNNMCSS